MNRRGQKSAADYDYLALSYHLKKSPLYEGLHVECMDPDWISVTEDDRYAARYPDKAGRRVGDYERTAPYLTDICDRVMGGEDIRDIMGEHGAIGEAARQYFDPKTMIHADVYGGDEIRLDGHGVQQLIAAQNKNVPVPVISIMQPERTFEYEMEASRSRRRLPELPYEDPPFMRDDFNFSPTFKNRRLPDGPDTELYEPEVELWSEDDVAPAEQELYDPDEVSMKGRRQPFEGFELSNEQDDDLEVGF